MTYYIRAYSGGVDTPLCDFAGQTWDHDGHVTCAHSSFEEAAEATKLLQIWNPDWMFIVVPGPCPRPNYPRDSYPDWEGY